MRRLRLLGWRESSSIRRWRALPWTSLALTCCRLTPRRDSSDSPRTCSGTRGRRRSRQEPSRCSACSWRGQRLGGSEVNRSWPQDALSYASTVAAALSELGGVELARKAELDPAV